MTSAETSIGAMSTVIGLILVQVAGVALYGLALAGTRPGRHPDGARPPCSAPAGRARLQLGLLATLEALLVVAPAVVAAPWLSRSVVDLLGRWGPAAGTGLDLPPPRSRGGVGGRRSPSG